MKKNFSAAILIFTMILASCSFPGSTTPGESSQVPEDVTSPTEPPIGESGETVDWGTHLSDLGVRYETVSRIVDEDTSDSGPGGFATGGDDPSSGRYERPFNPMMVYLDPIDILSASLAPGDSYFFIDIQTAGNNPYSGALDARYAIELDTDLDGRGNYLIWIVPPYDLEWSTAPIMIFQDGNGDVGGPTPIYADSGGSGDGYDLLLFDGLSLVSEPVSLARLNPENPGMLQLAFDPAFLGTPVSYLWWVWADGSVACPQCLDYNDYMDISIAGSPIQGAANFPINYPFALDNTCRAPYGFDPTGRELGICSGSSTSRSTGMEADADPGASHPSDGTPGGTSGGEGGGGEEGMPASARIAGYTFLDDNLNGLWDPSESTAMIYPVGLYESDCSTLMVSIYPESDGKYTFDGLIGGGDFCVHPDTAGLFWSPSYVNLSLGAGEDAIVNFGLQSTSGGEGGEEGGGEEGMPASASIFGYTYLDDNHNGNWDAAEGTTAEYPVALYDSSCTTRYVSVFPASDGKYIFDGLIGGGNYCVKPDSVGQTWSPVHSVLSLGAGDNAVVHFGLQREGSGPTDPGGWISPAAMGMIAGFVSIDENGNGPDSTDPPASGYSVVLYDYTCTTALASFIPDAYGFFTFTRLPPGQYCVGIIPADVSTQVVTVPEGGNVAAYFGVPVYSAPIPPPPPPPPEVISLFVFLVNGCEYTSPPSVGTQVEISDSSGYTWTTFSDGEGKAGDRSLPPGIYVINIPGRTTCDGYPATFTFDASYNTSMSVPLTP